MSTLMPPDTATMLWDFAKIVLGVSVTSISPLLIWIAKMMRRHIKKQEELTRWAWGEDEAKTAGIGADVKALLTDVADLKSWRRTNELREEYAQHAREDSLRKGGRS